MKYILVLLLFATTSVYANHSLSWLHQFKHRTISVANSTVVDKLLPLLIAGAAAVMIACSTTGCSEFEYQDYEYEYNERIYFLRNGLAYSGQVKKPLDDDRYVVQVNDTDERTTVSENDIRGRYAPNKKEYFLQGEAVLLEGNREGIKHRHGTIVRFYDDGYVEIRIIYETTFSDDHIELADPYTIFVDENLTLAEGGFVVGNFF